MFICGACAFAQKLYVTILQVLVLGETIPIFFYGRDQEFLAIDLDYGTHTCTTEWTGGGDWSFQTIIFDGKKKEKKVTQK